MVKIDADTDRELDCVRTRDAVVTSLLENGPQTAAALAGRLGLSPAAIRRHLDGLEAEHQVAARDQEPLGPRGRGRPARVFALTDSGREGFPHAYDDLASAALRFLQGAGGDNAVRDFAEHRAATLSAALRDKLPYGVDPAADELAGTSASPAVETLAAALTDEGYAASAQRVSSGDQICQHHCPVAHVAAEFPQLCEAETEAFARLLGTHVQRLATIAHGDGVCTTYVPTPARVHAPRTTTAAKESA